MDWIEGFLELTEGKPTPRIFRLWSGIGAISGALERRVFVRTSQSQVFANLFVVLVGPPASGKTQAIDVASEIWVNSKKFFTAPNSVTSASLIDAIAEADRKIIVPPPEMMIEYHSLLVSCSELGVLVNQHDMEFLSNLNYIYDNPKVYRQKRRHMNGGKEIQIVHPQLTVLAGTQPGFLASLLPEEAWAMGFTSRMLMVYGHSAPHTQLFGDTVDRTPKQVALTKEMIKMAGLMGQVQWEPAAAEELESWYLAKMPPTPEHSKLTHYNGRRILNILKLSMIAAVSRSRDELVIRIEDFERAKDWLLEAEKLMPDIFREMVLRSDFDTMMELHFFLWTQYIRTNKKSIHESTLVSFLANRVPSEKIMRIIDTAMGANMLTREAGSDKMYIPRPKSDFGVE